MINIYAAGPIDLGEDIPNWRSQLIDIFHDLGASVALFDPSSAYKNSQWGGRNNSRSLYIEQINKHALEAANFFIVCLPKGVSTIGTPIEVNFAYDACKTIYIITDIRPGQSIYLDNRIPDTNWFHVEDIHNKDQFYATLHSMAADIYAPKPRDTRLEVSHG